jgi:hypothetical protein
VFAQALAEIVRRLDDAKARGLLDHYALIGGFAVSAWGIPRATQDVGFALAIGSTDPATLSRHLHTEFQPGEADDPLRGVFRTHVTVDDGSVPVQLILLPSEWNSIVFQNVESLPLLDQTVQVVSWQALILLKLYAGGPQDRLDAQHILSIRRPGESERRTVSALAEQLGLSVAWNSLLTQ